ncbi:N-acetyltransferase [uncultured Roseobacter sp.]|uniref:GNAT family N-acetyltransferase n=1 Tax=uncultured Roseobacter sp. TaxID=114847 RepID=UPI00262A6D4B|nr:GNAT family N-acetyltransferase [uncultured Roseobacter sp.]
MSEDCRVRPLAAADSDAALALYNELTFGPPVSDPAAFLSVLDHPGTAVLGAFTDTGLVAMLTLHLLPNVTWSARPYALIENVVTRGDQQRRGFGRRVMQAALEAAWDADAYKVMLLTGQKRGARGFYESVGFSAEDKHAMVARRP